MDSDATDVVRVGLKHMDPLQGVVVEHTDLHVILSREKTTIQYLLNTQLIELINTTINKRAKNIAQIVGICYLSLTQ